ncbi:MAG: deoxyribose-phosphate aldolase [Chitinophagales bacterium]
MVNISRYIDHTFLKPVTRHTDIRKLCDEAIQYQFAAVCVPPTLVTYSKRLLRESDIRIATVIGFPFGYSVTSAKISETIQAIDDGADELDVVINLISLKNGDWGSLENEMEEISGLVHGRSKLIKVIIETGALSNEEIISCCSLYGRMPVDFLKTSTGFMEKGVTIEAVKLMKKNLPSTVRIKASGGIRNYAFAKELIEAGATRLGSSSGVAILEEELFTEKNRNK